MNRYSQQAIIYAKRYTRDWDYYLVASDAYSQGYKDARQDSGDLNLGDEEVKLDAKDGLHQLTGRSFFKWKEDNFKLPLKELLKLYVPMINFDDLRVIEDKDGNVSFQGKGKRNKP